MERHFDFRVQDCLHCDQRLQPRRALWGIPTADMNLPLALGEVVAVGCMLGPGDAVCPMCGGNFTPEWTWSV